MEKPEQLFWPTQYEDDMMCVSLKLITYMKLILKLNINEIYFPIICEHSRSFSDIRQRNNLLDIQISNKSSQS